MKKMTAFTDSEYTYLQNEGLEILNSMVVIGWDYNDEDGINYVFVADNAKNHEKLARLVPDVEEYAQQYRSYGDLHEEYETTVIDVQWAAWDYVGAKWFDGEKFLLHAPLDLDGIKERVKRVTEGS